MVVSSEDRQSAASFSHLEFGTKSSVRLGVVASAAVLLASGYIAVALHRRWEFAAIAYANSYARLHPALDDAVWALTAVHITQGVVLVAAVWWVWPRVTDAARARLPVGMAASALAAVASRALQIVLPTHLRPLHEPGAAASPAFWRRSQRSQQIQLVPKRPRRLAVRARCNDLARARPSWYRGVRLGGCGEFGPRLRTVPFSFRHRGRRGTWRAGRVPGPESPGVGCWRMDAVLGDARPGLVLCDGLRVQLSARHAVRGSTDAGPGPGQGIGGAFPECRELARAHLADDKLPRS